MSVEEGVSERTVLVIGHQFIMSLVMHNTPAAPLTVHPSIITLTIILFKKNDIGNCDNVVDLKEI